LLAATVSKYPTPIAQYALLNHSGSLTLALVECVRVFVHKVFEEFNANKEGLVYYKSFLADILFRLPP